MQDWEEEEEEEEGIQQGDKIKFLWEWETTWKRRE